MALLGADGEKEEDEQNKFGAVWTGVFGAFLFISCFADGVTGDVEVC
jgi:hypothetical protein